MGARLCSKLCSPPGCRRDRILLDGAIHEARHSGVVRHRLQEVVTEEVPAGLSTVSFIAFLEFSQVKYHRCTAGVERLARLLCRLVAP